MQKCHLQFETKEPLAFCPLYCIMDLQSFTFIYFSQKPACLTIFSSPLKCILLILLLTTASQTSFLIVSFSISLINNNLHFP